MARTAGCPTLHDQDHHIHQPTPTTPTSSQDHILYHPTPQIQLKSSSLDDSQQHNGDGNIPDMTQRRGSQSVPPPVLKSSCLSPPKDHAPRSQSVRFSPEPPQVFHYPAAPHEKAPKATLFLPWDGQDA